MGAAHQACASLHQAAIPALAFSLINAVCFSNTPFAMPCEKASDGVCAEKVLPCMFCSQPLVCLVPIQLSQPPGDTLIDEFLSVYAEQTGFKVWHEHMHTALG